MGGMHNRVRGKAMGGVNGYYVYALYRYHRSGIEGSTVSFKVALVLK